MKDFTDKVVVITGAATGIGFSFAKAFGAEGAKVLVSGRREDRLQEAEDELTGLGVDARHAVCDVTDRAQVEALADVAWETFGRVDVVVNNAGIMLPPRPILDTPEDDVHRIFAVNVFGVWHGSAVFGKRFVEQGTPAAIYNVGSENSLFHGVPAGAPYVASKHAVLAITESLAEEMPDFVEVGLICPGFVRSELIPDEATELAMDTDRYTAIAMQQIRNGEFFIVSHAFNIVRIEERHRAVVAAYEQYAPRYEGDVEYDVRTLLEAAGAAGDELTRPSH